ncbi:MAG: 2-C-methyl-D-erythritol 4-phosphate cytidylyltransferase, partial [Oscillospiraceae bacterium]
MEQNILLDAPTAAVIVAAGLSSRMRGIDKILAPLRDEPVLWHTLHAFEQCEAIGEIVVVTRSILIQAVQDMIRARGLHKVWHVVEGGETRQQSTYKGVCALSSGSSLVCVHDGARPLVSGQVILAAISAARNHGAATAAIPVKDTIKEEHNGFVACTY